MLQLLVLLAASDQAAPSDSGPLHPRRPVTACTVTRIGDGDTIQCDGKTRVRLTGIDAPETDQGSFGTGARDALESLIPRGSRVDLEPDVEGHDQYHRTLAYVWYRGQMINWLMVRRGWAVPYPHPPNVQYVDYFSHARDRARAERKGLWAVDGFRCEPSAHRAGRC